MSRFIKAASGRDDNGQRNLQRIEHDRQEVRAMYGSRSLKDLLGEERATIRPEAYQRLREGETQQEILADLFERYGVGLDGPSNRAIEAKRAAIGQAADMSRLFIRPMSSYR